MSTSIADRSALTRALRSSNAETDASRLARRLPPLLSIIAGMVDVTGFLTLGHIFTAHITGNLVVTAAAVVRGAGSLNPAQGYAIPVAMFALAAAYIFARATRAHGVLLARRLLVVQFMLLAIVLILSVATHPSLQPDGLWAGVTAMVAVSAMACQYALFRLAIPEAVSTAAMTGNLTNAVLALMDKGFRSVPLIAGDDDRLKKSLYLLLSFLVGCVVATAATQRLDSWAWSLPAALAALAIFWP
jgi:uncharacterized membrane protein YoaK (UPF0700 family)